MSRSVRPKLRSAADRRDVEDRSRLRLVKRLVREERQRAHADVPPIFGEAIPITVHGGRHAAYAASPDDVRAILSRLPPGVVTGLAGIELTLDDREHERRRREWLPGVFSHGLLGQYSPDQQRIQLFGFIYDRARPDLAALELYLRSVMLATLVHEVAHHEDHMSRGGRRQWRAEDIASREAWANAREREWEETIVAPYLAETYPNEIAAAALLSRS